MLSLKKRKTPIQKKTMKHKKVYLYTISLFLFSSFVAIWFVFLDSVSVLRFNFVFFCVCVSGWGCLLPFWDLCFCFLVVFFCFGFPFCLCVSVFGLFSPIFVVVVVVLWFFCFYRPPYIFDSPLHLNPTTGEHFKTPLKISSQRSNRSGKK